MLQIGRGGKKQNYRPKNVNFSPENQSHLNIALTPSPLPKIVPNILGLLRTLIFMDKHCVNSYSTVPVITGNDQRVVKITLLPYIRGLSLPLFPTKGGEILVQA
jgi:hypothetical protein